MAGRATTRLEMTADGTAVVRELDDITDAAEKADKAVQPLEDGVDLDADASGVLGELDRLQAEAEEVERSLRDVDDVRIDPDVDTSGIDRAQRSTKGLSDTAQRGIGPLRGLTDELGDQSNEAGILANALIDGGEAFEIMAESAGLSERAIQGVVRAFRLAGPVIAGAATLFVAWRRGIDNAKRSMEQLIEVQEDLLDDRHRDAAEKLAEAYGSQFDDMIRFGLDAQEIIDAVTSSTGSMTEASLRYMESLAPHQQAQYIAWLETVNTRFGEAEQRVKATGELVDGLTVALGGTVETTEELDTSTRDLGTTSGRVYRDMVSNIDRADRALQAYLDNVDSEQAWAALQEQARSTWEAIAAATDASAEDQKAAVAEVESQYNLLREEVARYAADVLGLPSEYTLNLLAKLDEGQIAEVMASIERLRPVITARMDVVLGNTPPSTYVPGLDPIPDPGGTIPDNVRRAEGGAQIVNQTVNVQRSLDPRHLVASSDEWRRVNGYPL